MYCSYCVVYLLLCLNQDLQDYQIIRIFLITSCSKKEPKRVSKVLDKGNPVNLEIL